MKTQRLVDLLLRASLLTAPGCCMDHTDDTRFFVPRSQFGNLIDACFADSAKCNTLCDTALGLSDSGEDYNIEKCEVVEVKTDGVTLDARVAYVIDCLGGRRPAGFVEPEQRSGAGEWLARLATVEAASVTAFVRLARALERLSAPRSMIAAARRAIADEIVHARIVARLARSHGASPQNPEISEQAEPSLAQLAHENAVEGQVAETFGALIATCQAQHATDPEIRAVFSKIARDEARHAALAHRLAPWLERQLAPDERAAVVDARRSAVAAIAQSGDLGLSAADRELLGVPAPDRLRVAAAATFAALA